MMMRMTNGPKLLAQCIRYSIIIWCMMRIMWYSNDPLMIGSSYCCNKELVSFGWLVTNVNQV